MNVLVLDDHTLYRQSLCRALELRIPDVKMYDCGTSKDAEAIIQEMVPDLVLLDLNLGTASGLEALKLLRYQVQGFKVLIVSMHTDMHMVGLAFKAGIDGFVTKDASVEKLVVAILQVMAGNKYFDTEIIELLSQMVQIPGMKNEPGSSAKHDVANYSSLTKREQEIFHLLAKNLSIGDIAQQLNRSEKTVENHRSSLYQKLGLTDRFELFAYAKKLGLIF